MDSFITEDIDSLIQLKKGDLERLNRIKNLCENNKLIPISDRKYVERLVSQYLSKHEVKEKKHIDAKPVLEEKPTQFEMPQDSAFSEKHNEIEKKLKDSTILLTRERTEKHFGDLFELSSKRKIIFGIAAIFLAIIVISIVSLDGSIGTFPQEQDTTIVGNDLIPPYITLFSDEKSYKKADLISISGKSNPIIAGKIRIVIEKSAGNIIWAENVQVKDNGEFSTLLIAGGEGWKDSGQYTIIASHDTLEARTTFDFIS
jgi:hypothetical protein